MLDVVWDMETGDPDDFFTLMLLCGHPDVNLKAVTVTPGTTEQLGLVKWVLDKFNKTIPIGSFNISNDKSCVSDWYYNAYGLNKMHYYGAEPGGKVIFDNCDMNTTIITGAPLKNFRLAMDMEFKVGRWFAQGGFAGKGVVPPDMQLPKFKDMVTCPTYNLNGDPKTALKALEYGGFGQRYFISKNICHGVYYDKEMHDTISKFKDSSLSMSLIYHGMSHYLNKTPDGKKFHDPLAACCAINPSIGTWRNVKLYREKGQWGSKISFESNANIIIAYDKDLFIETLTQQELK